MYTGMYFYMIHFNTFKYQDTVYMYYRQAHAKEGYMYM